MSGIGKSVGKVVGSVASAIGLKDVYLAADPGKKFKRPMPGLPDEDAVTLEARRRAAKRALKGGRASTILDSSDETLG